MNRRHPDCLRYFVLAVWVLPALPVAAQELAPLVSVYEPRIGARLIDIQNRRVRWETATGTWELDWDQIVSWGWWQDSAGGPQVVLQDGSVLPGDLTSLRVSDIALTTRMFGDLRVPRESLAGIIFRPPAETGERDRLLLKLIDAGRDRDSVLLLNGDELDGIAVSGEGHPAGVPATTLLIGSAKTLVGIENVVAASYQRSNRRNSEKPPLILWIGLSDGTRLAVAHLAWVGGRVQLQLQSGVSLSVAASQLWPHVTWIQPVATRYSFLSDRPTAGFKHIPFLSTPWTLGIDRNVLGGALRSAGHFYSKGLGMHSAARSAYHLGRQFRWFEADLALDDAAQTRGSVVFRVFIDRSPAGQLPEWKLAYESPVVRGGAPPIPVRVDLTGAEQLALVVDFAERGDERDYANWLLARLIP